jgi:hypothetical protein
LGNKEKLVGILGSIVHRAFGLPSETMLIGTVVYIYD